MKKISLMKGSDFRVFPSIVLGQLFIVHQCIKDIIYPAPFNSLLDFPYFQPSGSLLHQTKHFCPYQFSLDDLAMESIRLRSHGAVPLYFLSRTYFIAAQFSFTTAIVGTKLREIIWPKVNNC